MLGVAASRLRRSTRLMAPERRQSWSSFSAEVKLLHRATNAADAVKTGADGAYTFPALLPRAYRLEASSQGFKMQTISDIRLEVNQTTGVEVKLQVGEIVQGVGSPASLQLLKTDTSDGGGVIANKTIVELPLTGRDYPRLTRLSPGAPPSRAGATAGGKGVSRSANGAGANDRSITFLLNGVGANNAIFPPELLRRRLTPSMSPGSSPTPTAPTSGAGRPRPSPPSSAGRTNGIARYSGSTALVRGGRFLPAGLGGAPQPEPGPSGSPQALQWTGSHLLLRQFRWGRRRPGGTGFAYAPSAGLRGRTFSGGGKPLIDGRDTWNAAAWPRQPFAGNRIQSTHISPLATKVMSSTRTATRCSSNFDNTPSNPQCRCDLRAEKGPAAFDIRHRAVISYSYELPFGKGRKWRNAGGWADRLVGGWQLNGITALQSGPPFTLATPGDNANIGSSAQRPDVVGDPYSGVDRGADIRRRGVDQGATYFNKAAFVMPALFRLGSVGKNTLYGPGSQSWDFSVFKNTNLAEKLNLQLRAEFFNLPNHPNFGLPNRTINQPTTGMITGAGSPRIIQFGVKLIL
jgi:hypothetical protein